MESKVFGIAALTALLTAILACSSTVATVQGKTPLRLSARWVMLPFANYAETPQAGERVEALMDTLLRKDGISSLDRYPPLKEDDAHLILSDRQRYEESLAWARGEHFDYAVAGSVEEWRYKSGVDGEPVVGVTIEVIELPTNRVLWSGSGTRTGSGVGNVSGTALGLLGSLLGHLRVTR